MASTKKELAKAKNNDNLVIDYATTRDKTLKKQEQRILAIEKKVINLCRRCDVSISFKRRLVDSHRECNQLHPF